MSRALDYKCNRFTTCCVQPDLRIRVPDSQFLWQRNSYDSKCSYYYRLQYVYYHYDHTDYSRIFNCPSACFNEPSCHNDNCSPASQYYPGHRIYHGHHGIGRPNNVSDIGITYFDCGRGHPSRHCRYEHSNWEPRFASSPRSSCSQDKT